MPVLTRAWLNSTSGFVWDDVKNLREAQVQGMSAHYLFEPTFGHWSPGHRFGDWALERLFPFNFTMAQAFLLTGFAIVLLLFHLILKEVFTPGPGATLLTLLFGTSVVYVGVLQWWASGLDVVPATIGSFLSIWAYLRLHRTRSWWWLALSLLSLAIALCFYVKPIFIPLYLVLIRVMLLEPDRPLRETSAAVIREWRVWLAYAITTGSFLVVYVRTYPTQLNQRPSAGVLVHYLALLWFRVIAPSLAGLYLPVNSSSAVVAAGIVVGQVSFLAVVVASVKRWLPAWRAWAFFAAGFAVNALIVGLTRIGVYPPVVIAYALRYNPEIIWLFFLAAGFAFLRLRTQETTDHFETGDPPETAHTRPAMLPRATGSIERVAVAVGVVLYLILSWQGAVQLSAPSFSIGHQSGSYLRNAAAGLRAVTLTGAKVALVDGEVPETVVPAGWAPYNSFSEVTPLIDDKVGFDVTGRTLYDFAKDGRIRPVAFTPLAGGDAGAMIAAGTLVVVGAPIEPSTSGDGVCIAPTAAIAGIVLAAPAPLVSGQGLYLDMEFTSGTESVMTLVVDPVGSTPPGPDRIRVVHLHRSSQHTVYELGQSTAHNLAVLVPPGARFCLHRLQVGELHP